MKINQTKCKWCVNVVCDDDSISCHRCEKKYHWICTSLSDYEIKLHRKNPYKPWRCEYCRENFCKHCDRSFATDLESICCDKCSFWYHFDCSNLSEIQFKQLSDNPDLPWTCSPCKRILCVNCNSSTHNKPRITCCLCHKLYHNVCVGLPKSLKQSDWLCNSCRPSVFPFHRVDHKTLLKLSCNSDRYSLENLSILASHMSRCCSVCTTALSRSNPGIPCFSCNSKVHVKCSKINDAKNYNEYNISLANEVTYIYIQ